MVPSTTAGGCLAQLTAQHGCERGLSRGLLGLHNFCELGAQGWGGSDRNTDHWTLKLADKAIDTTLANTGTCWKREPRRPDKMPTVGCSGAKEPPLSPPHGSPPTWPSSTPHRKWPCLPLTPWASPPAPADCAPSPQTVPFHPMSQP